MVNFWDWGQTPYLEFDELPMNKFVSFRAASVEAVQQYPSQILHFCTKLAIKPMSNIMSRIRVYRGQFVNFSMYFFIYNYKYL